MSAAVVPEVGDIVVIVRPTPAQIERLATTEPDADGLVTVDVGVDYVKIVEIREPGFLVVRDAEKLDPAAEAYAIMTCAPLTVAYGYRPATYKARAAWIQFEGEAPRRTLIARLLKRYEVKPETVARMFPRDPESEPTR